MDIFKSTTMEDGIQILNKRIFTLTEMEASQIIQFIEHHDLNRLNLFIY